MTNNFTVKLRFFTSWLQKIQLCELANAWTSCIDTSNTQTRKYNRILCHYQVHYVLMIQTELIWQNWSTKLISATLC